MAGLSIDGLQFDGVLFFDGRVEGQIDFGGVGQADAVDCVVLLVEGKLQFFHVLIIYSNIVEMDSRIDYFIPSSICSCLLLLNHPKRTPSNMNK